MSFDPSTAIAVDEVKPSGFDPSTATPLEQPKPGYEPYKASMADVGISGGEFENVQPVVLPEFGQPGTFTRGISKGLTGAVEFATSTPGVAMGPAFAIPYVGPALGVGMSAYALWEAAKKATEAIEKKSPEAAGEATFAGVLGLLGAAGGAKGITESAKVLPKTTAEAVKAIIPPPIQDPSRLLQAPKISRYSERIVPLQSEAGTGIPMPEFVETSVIPPERQLAAKRIISPQFTESTRLEALRTGQPTEAVERIVLPVEPETAAKARKVWSKVIDVEAQVEGADALRQLSSMTEEQKSPGQPYKPPTVNVDLRQLERMMQRNTVSKVESWADQVIQQKLGDFSANPFMDPAFIAAVAAKGAILFKRGVTTFAEWSAAMHDQFGRGMDAMLPGIYEQSKRYWEQKQPPSPTETPAPTASPTPAPQPAPSGGIEVKESSAPVEAEAMPGVMVDKSIANPIRQINESGYRTINSDSGLRVDHPGETKLQRGYITFDAVDPQKLATVSQAGKESGFIVEDVSTHEGSGAEFVGTTKSVTLRIPSADLSDAAKASMWNSLSDKLKPTPPVAQQAQPPVIDPSFQPTALATEASKVEGITPSPVAPLDIGDKLSSAMRRWFTVAGHLPQEVHEAAVKMGNLRAAADRRIVMQERDLREALKEVYGLSRLQMAGGGLRRIPSGAVQLMDDYMHGRVANPTIIPPQVRSVLDTMRAEIDAQSSQIVTELTRQANQLPPTSAKAKSLHDLINKIKDNMDVYVHRSYKFFDSSKGAPEWYKKLNAGVRIKAEDYIMQNGPPGMTQAEAQSKILDWLSDLKNDTAFTGGGGTLGAKDLSIFMKRGVIAPELRAVLGEYHDPVINYAKSVSKMADWVAKQRFLNEVRRIGMGRFLFEEGANPPGFNTQIAGEGSNVMSPLNGLRTSEEIALAFHDLQSTPAKGLWRGYLVLNAFSKFAATGLSMLTQMRNLLSRPLMSLMAGHLQLGKAGVSIKAIAQDFAGRDPAWRSYLNRLYELGVIGDTARSGELQAIIKDAALKDVQPGELYSWSIAKALKQYGYKIPAEIYRLSDDFGNIFGFENEKAIQRKVHPTWTPEQIEVEAAKITRELYPTYSETPRAIKEFRKTAIVGPFVTFPYQMFRTVFNGMARSIYELRSSNPTERVVGAKRLAGQMAAITGTAVLAEMSKSMLGINNKQEEDLRRFQPEWSKNSKFMFTGKDDKGKLSYVNLSYLDPYSYITDPVNAIISASRSDKPLHETMLDVVGETLRPWVSEQMLLQSILEARNGKTDTGREIWNKTDNALEIGLKSVKHVMNVLKPGTMQRIERRILPAIRNEQPPYGRKLEVGPEIAREMTGLAIEQFDFRNGLAFRSKAFTDMDREAESLFHKTVSRTQTTTPTDIINSYQQADQRRFLIWKEMRKDFLAAVRQGVPVDEAKKLMNARGVSKNDALGIATGQYIPMPISDQTMKLARERKRTLPINELQQYQSSVYHKSLDEPVK